MASYKHWADQQIQGSDDGGHSALIKAIVHSSAVEAIGLLRQGANQRGLVAYNTAWTALHRCRPQMEEDAYQILKEVEKCQDKKYDDRWDSDDTDSDDVHLPSIFNKNDCCNS